MRLSKLEKSEICGVCYPVLDKGHVILVDYMGDDQRVVDAARVCVGDKGTTANRKLINYLLKHGHTSPFEQVVFTFRVKCPIFVARQWCIGGDTLLHFETGYKGEYRRNLTVKEAWRIFNSKYKNRLKARRLRKLYYKRQNYPPYNTCKYCS